MNSHSTDTRDALRARIEAAERRNAERTLADQARDAATAAVDYTRANPLTVIGGAIAAGLVIGLLTRPGRRVASRAVHSAGDAISGAAASASSGAKGLAVRGGSRIGQLLGEALMAYVMTVIDEVLDTARAGQEAAEDLSGAASAKAKQISGQLSGKTADAADTTRALARKTAAAVRDLATKSKG